LSVKAAQGALQLNDHQVWAAVGQADNVNISLATYGIDQRTINMHPYFGNI
jgi:hypothetical protein